MSIDQHHRIHTCQFLSNRFNPLTLNARRHGIYNDRACIRFEDSRITAHSPQYVEIITKLFNINGSQLRIDISPKYQ